LRIERACFVQLMAVLALPSKRCPGPALQSRHINATALEKRQVLRREIFPYHCNEIDAGKVAGCSRKEGGRSPKNLVDLPKRCFHRIQRDRPDNEQLSHSLMHPLLCRNNPIHQQSQFLSEGSRHPIRCRDNGMLQGVLTATCLDIGHPRQRRSQQSFGQRDILTERGQDRLNRDGLFSLMPTIVVCRQGPRGVKEFCLTRKLGLRQIRHPDHTRAPLAIQPRLSFSRKLRSFDAEVYTALMHSRADCTGRSQQYRTERGADWIAKCHMCDNPSLKEGGHPPLGEVDKLLRHEQVLPHDPTPS